MMTDVDLLIENSLSRARSVIEDSGTWEPLVQIVHPLGVQTMRAPGLQAGSIERAKATGEINHQLSVLKGILVITVADVWISEDTPEGLVVVSLDMPFSGRRKALHVEVQSCCDRLCSIQKYRRCAGGQVCFDEYRSIGTMI